MNIKSYMKLNNAITEEIKRTLDKPVPPAKTITVDGVVGGVPKIDKKHSFS